MRTPRGRILTPAAFEHLGKTPPATQTFMQAAEEVQENEQTRLL